MSLFHIFEAEDYGHIGYEGRESIQVLSLPESEAARILVEILPANRIRWIGLRTSASNRMRYRKANTLFMQIRKTIQVDRGLLFSR